MESAGGGRLSTCALVPCQLRSPPPYILIEGLKAFISTVISAELRPELCRYQCGEGGFMLIRETEFIVGGGGGKGYEYTMLGLL